MSFDAEQMKRARDSIRKRMPRQLRRDLDKAAEKVGRQGVKIARTLVARDSGETASLITHEAKQQRGRDGGWYYSLRVFVNAQTKAQAIKSFVIEFGRGQGRAGAFARGSLPPRPYLRPSRELTAKKARSAFSRAMRQAANAAFAR